MKYYIFIQVVVVTVLLATLITFMILYRKSSKAKNGAKKATVEPYTSQEMAPTAQLELHEESISEEMNYVAQRFLDYFEREKPYLNPDLHIVDVAQHIFTNKTYLSRAINVKFGKNFSQVVHWYRIRDAIEIYTKSSDLSIQDLYLRVGFRSLSTYNTAFSRCTGKTPVEWCKFYKKIEKNVK